MDGKDKKQKNEANEAHAEREAADAAVRVALYAKSEAWVAWDDASNHYRRVNYAKKCDENDRLEAEVERMQAELERMRSGRSEACNDAVK